MKDYDYSLSASNEVLTAMAEVANELDISLEDVRVSNEIYFICGNADIAEDGTIQNFDAMVERARRVLKDGIDVWEEKQDIYSMISDMHKDAHGFRLRLDITDYTIIQLLMMEDQISVELSRAVEEERRDQQKAIQDLEDQIQNMIEFGAKDRATAIRWIVESYDTMDLMYGVEYIQYDLGLPYNYFVGKDEWKDAVTARLQQVAEEV